MNPLDPRQRDLIKCEDMRIHAEREQPTGVRMERSMDRQRPVPITVLGVLNVLFGLPGWVAGASHMAHEGVLVEVPVAFLWSSGLIVSGLGLLFLKRWARMLTLVLYGLKLVMLPYSWYKLLTAAGPLAITAGHVLLSAAWTAFNLAVLFLLTRPRMKQVFSPLCSETSSKSGSRPALPRE